MLLDWSYPPPSSLLHPFMENCQITQSFQVIFWPCFSVSYETHTSFESSALKKTPWWNTLLLMPMKFLSQGFCGEIAEKSDYKWLIVIEFCCGKCASKIRKILKKERKKEPGPTQYVGTSYYQIFLNNFDYNQNIMMVHWCKENDWKVYFSWGETTWRPLSFTENASIS